MEVAYSLSERPNIPASSSSPNYPSLPGGFYGRSCARAVPRRPSSQFDSLAKKVNMSSEEVTEDAANGDNRINPGFAQFFRGDEFQVFEPGAGYAYQPHFQIREYLGYGISPCLYRFKTPEHQSQAFGISSVLLVKFLEHLGRSLFTHPQSSMGWDKPGVKLIHIVANWENSRGY